MSRSDTLPIFLDTYKLVQELYRETAKFSKDYKFSLGQNLQKDVLSLLQHIYEANHQSDKRPYLSRYLSTLEMVQMQIRLASDLKLISLRKQAHLSRLIETIGKQATAWQRHERARIEGVQPDEEDKSAKQKEQTV